jgi:predicted nucleic acid-binding protein
MPIGIYKVSYLDACAAVKLVIPERGSDHLKAYFARHSFSITGFCLFEAFGVLKRKMHKREILRDQYFYACYMLIAYLQGKRICIDEEPEIDSMATFIRAQKFANDHDLDLSDALQLLSVKHGKFCKLAKESKTVLITSDKALAKAAKTEGLPVWNCEKESEPPNFRVRAP